MILRPHPLLETDLEEVFQYYRSIRPELGGQLLDEYIEGIHLIIQQPKAHPLVGAGVRRYRLPTFPYGITYREVEDGSYIALSLLHLKRRPGLWRQRLK
jgi:hypothetical protein